MHWLAVIIVFVAINLLPLPQWLAVAAVTGWLLAVYRYFQQRRQWTG